MCEEQLRGLESYLGTNTKTKGKTRLRKTRIRGRRWNANKTELDVVLHL